MVDLASQMAGDDLRIGVAAGLDQPGNPLGTDATAVARAIDEAWSEDGVLVLMDLGSAVLSAELALDLLPEERRRRVLLTEAPLVEGAVAAAVAAALGEPLEKVAAEARDGLAPKAAHLAAGSEAAPTPTPIAPPTASGMLTLRFTVRNLLGLHARPAAALVRTAAALQRRCGRRRPHERSRPGERPQSERRRHARRARGSRGRGEGLRTAGRGGPRRHRPSRRGGVR